MGAVRAGGELDLPRAAQHIMRWWREGRHIKEPSSSSDASNTPQQSESVRGWGLDFFFGGREVPLSRVRPLPARVPGPSTLADEVRSGDHLQLEMDTIIDRFLEGLRGTPNGLGVSSNQLKKQEKERKKVERERKRAEWGQ